MQKTLHSVQCLRGIAAMLVVIYHSQKLLETYQSRIGIPPSIVNATPNLSIVGASGVDLFFVISGFIMAYITCAQRGPHAILPFLKRRLVRIVPLYWFFTLIMAGLLLFFPNLFSSARFDGRGTLLSLLFIPYSSAVSPNSPVLAVGWTLSYEMYFYVLVACGFVLKYHVFSLVLGLFLAGSIALGYLFPSNDPVFNLMTSPILCEFYLGYLCGSVFMTKKVILPKSLAFFYLASGVAGYMLWTMESVRLPLGLFAFLIVTGCIFLEKYFTSKSMYYLARIGDSSYSLYLSNYLLIPALGKICTAAGFWNHFPPAAFIALSLPACVAAGYLAYVFVERPLLTCGVWKTRKKAS